MNGSTPGSFVHGILQARILEWVAISSSRSSLPREEDSSVPQDSLGREIRINTSLSEPPELQPGLQSFLFKTRQLAETFAKFHS